MKTSSLKSKRKNKMGLIEIWTIVSVILHFAGVGMFAEWPVIAGPFTWSCVVLEMWVIGLYVGALVLLFLLSLLKK